MLDEVNQDRLISAGFDPAAWEKVHPAAKPAEGIRSLRPLANRWPWVALNSSLRSVPREGEVSFQEVWNARAEQSGGTLATTELRAVSPESPRCATDYTNRIRFAYFGMRSTISRTASAGDEAACT